jgi:hypothetical protein
MRRPPHDLPELGMSVSLPIFIQLQKYNGCRRTSHLCQRLEVATLARLRGGITAGGNVRKTFTLRQYQPPDQDVAQA